MVSLVSDVQPSTKLLIPTFSGTKTSSTGAGGLDAQWATGAIRGDPGRSGEACPVDRHRPMLGNGPGWYVMGSYMKVSKNGAETFNSRHLAL